MKRPVIVGIAGDSGAGKSTYVQNLASLLGPEQVTVIGLDDYHTLDRAQRKLLGITPLNPKANDLGLLIDHAWQLRRGERIVKPVYDHSTGTFGQPEVVEPREFVILEGLHALFLEMLRQALDLKIYFDTHLELKLRWKIARDVTDRGHTREAVLKEIEQRQPDIRAFIEPQKKFADLIVSLVPGRGEGIAVRLAERSGEEVIGERLREVLPVRREEESLEGSSFAVLPLEEPVSGETMVEVVRSLGARDLILPSREEYDPVALSQVLVAWRILGCRESAALEGTYAA